MKTVFCLFEYSETFAKLYREKGYNVISVDLEFGIDIMTFDYKQYSNVEIIIAHPPCTEFAASGAVWWKKKNPKLLFDAISIVEKTLEIIEYHKPKIFFLENPKGRICSCVPKLKQFQKYSFNPFEFAGYSSEKEAYSKYTILYGRFNLPKKKPLPNLIGDKTTNLGWATKDVVRQRNLTPYGFAKAFVEANHNTEVIEQLYLF